MFGLCWSADMFVLQRRGWFLLSSAAATGAIILLVASLATQEWVRSDLVRTVTVNEVNRTYQLVAHGGYKHFGLFKGCEEKIFDTYSGPQRRCFNALREVEAISDVHLVYGTLVGIVSGIFFLIVAIHVCLYIECVTDVKDILETTSTYFIYTSAALSLLISCILYGYMFDSDFKDTILTEHDLSQGFKSHGLVKLSHSYWLTVVACIVVFFNLLGLCIVNVKHDKSNFWNPDFSRRRKAKSFKVSRDNNGQRTSRAEMMMY